MIAVKILKFIENLPRKISRLRDNVLRPFIVHIWPRCLTPNMISVFRIFLALVIIFMLFDYSRWHTWIIILFSVGLFTDLLDGTMARTLNMASKLGGVLDPVADKLLAIPLFFYLIKDFKSLLFSIIGIEIFAAFLALIGIFIGTEIKANMWGKWTFVFHATGLLILLLWANEAWAVPILWMAVGFGLASIIEHVYPFLVNENP